MSLTAADVAEILKLLEQSTFDELDLEINGVRLSLRRGAGSVREAATTSRVVSSAANSGASPGATPNSAATNAALTVATASDPNLQDVPSPLLGTFYRSPKPGAPPFVEVGSPVEENTVVAIIEVMKLMNTVRAGARGTVAEILTVDGALVEFEQPILRIRKAS